MPSVSKKQHNLMAAVAHSPKFAKKVGIPTSVGKDFMEADKGKKFRSGGALLQAINKPKTNHGKSGLFKEGGMAKKEMHSEKGEMKADIAQDKKLIKKAIAMHDKQEHPGKKTNLSKLKDGGRIASKGEHAVQKQSKRGAIEVKMCGGGKAKRYNGEEGSVVSRSPKAQKAYDEAIEGRAKIAKEMAERKQATQDAAYERAARQYTREKQFGDTDASMRKWTREKIGDPLTRGLTKVLGENDIDTGELKARKDILGYKKGGSTASKRADGCATKGKTRGRMI